MLTGEHFSGDQAEVVISDDVTEWMIDNITDSQRDEVLDDVVALFTQPWGKHPLSNRNTADHLAGFNTATTLRGDYRIVFRSTVTSAGTGLIQVVAIGRRTDSRVYDAVNALLCCGHLDPSLEQQIWDLLKIFEDTAERFGLELWDYQPQPASAGLVKAAVVTGALTREVAERLSADEITAALEEAWDPDTGELDPERALKAALRRVASSSDPEQILKVRSEPRCGAYMVRAKAPCIRRRGHPGAHRATA